MNNKNNKNTSSYTQDQIKRVIIGCGITIENEVETDFIMYCPFHPNNRTPAGEVDKRSGMFFCFSCHKIADFVEFVTHTSGRTYFEAVRFIKSKESESDISQEITKSLTKEPEFVMFDELIIKRLSVQALESPRAMRYYLGRSITEESIKKFSLGFSEKQDMLTIPVHAPDGMPVGFVGRSVEGKDFKNTPGLPKSKVLFNLHRVKTADRVYVVESSFDAIRLDQCGLPAVATLGSNVSNIQIEILQKYFNNIIVIADNDEAGENMKTKLVKKLGSRITVVSLDNKYKDIGDLSDDDIKKLDVSFDSSIASMLQ
jgi:DNA primase